MQDLLNNTINLSQTGLLYNPQLQNADTVEKLFVVRQKQFELLLNKVVLEEENSIPQHHLIIGQRGMGKTMFLKRMEVELHKEQYRRRFIPLLYREEQYNVKDLAEFWLNTLDALADSLQAEKYPAQMVADIDKTIMELSRKPPEIISVEAYKYLMDICRDLHRRPVLLIDNIGLIFGRLDSGKENKTEQWALRKLLSENGSPIVVSGGVTLVDDVNNYGMPFYDFFQIQQLYKLNYEEFTKLLLNLATITNRDKTIFDTINDSRQKSLLELTGGSPRLTVMLFEQIAKGFSSNINDDLEKLADSITPFYKARFEELPAQQQIIIDAIALNWDAISLKNLSIATRMQNNQLSPQLKRLVNDGWIETTTAYKVKGNAYFISERFFNIYYLIRNSSRRHKDKVYCLSRFLECFYGKEDLEKISDVLLKQRINSSENMLLFLALSNVKTLELGRREKIREKTYETFLTNEKFCKEFDFSDNNFISRVISLINSEQYCDAIDYLNKIINIKINDSNVWFMKGSCLYKIRQYEKAIDCYNKVIELNSNNEYAWFLKGKSLSDMGRNEEAIDCINKAIGLNLNNEYVWYLKGKCLSDMGRNEEAIDCINKAIGLNLNNEYAWFLKGKCLTDMQQFKEAIDCFNKTIELNKNDEYAWYWKGCCLTFMRQFKEAIDCFNKTIGLNKDNEYAWFLKGICLSEMGQYEEAVDCYNKSIDLNPKSFAACRKKGDVLIELQKYKDAANAYERSIEAEHEDLSSKFNMIFLYRDKLNEMNKAIELFSSINENKINEEESIIIACRFNLHKALFELYKQNNGLAKEYLLQAFEILQKEDKIPTIAGLNWWIKFGSVVINLNCGSWLIAILEEKGYNIVLSPYYTAIKALEIEQQDSKKDAEIYLNNQAVEIGNPAKEIVERIKKYL
jgi:tetratricopeptide (TPR) repeat protein